MIVELEPSWESVGEPLRHTWSGVVNVDQFRWLSRVDVLRQLELARDELGARHVRACAMYSPEMRVYTRVLVDWKNPDAAPRVNWQMVDLSLEMLLERGLKPVYTTCFTPPGFTDSQASCWPDRNPVGMPRDLEQWARFVADGVCHHARRFGLEELRTWLFECWNEPNLSSFFDGSREDFLRLWKHTWYAVKSVDEALMIGGPSTARGEWLEQFLDFCWRENVPPDYLISHVYNNDSESQPLCPFDGPAAHRVKDSPHFASGVIRGVASALREAGWSGPMHWNEWGRSWFPHDPLKETAREAAFVVKTMTEVSQEADVFAFWCLSDIYDQAGFQASEFDGHYGMLSLHGLKKPAYFAHQLLCRLGRLRLPVSGGNALQNALAACGVTTFQVLVFNYPENPLQAVSSDTFRLIMPQGVGRVNLIRIDSRTNNIPALWRTLGAKPSPNKSLLQQLAAANALCSSELDCDTSAPEACVTFELERPGIALIEFAVPERFNNHGISHQP